MWELLPPDLIISIAERLPVADYARFRAVCATWASAVKDSRSYTPSCFPWLCQKSTPFADTDDRPLSFFSCSDGRLYRLPLPANISAYKTHTSSVQLVGCRDGCMVLQLYDRFAVVNPLSGVQLSLPSLTALPCRCPCRRSDLLPTVIPCPARNLAFIVCSFTSTTGLAFAAPGDERWTHVFPHIGIYGNLGKFKDVVYHAGRFYALCPSGKMLAFELELSPSVTRASVLVAQNKYLDCHYVNFTKDMFLVSCPSGDLLQIRMVKYSPKYGLHQRHHQCGLVTIFIVMKFDAEADGWVEIEDLGDSCIFMDNHQAMLLSVDDDDSSEDDTTCTRLRLRRNCIYFAACGEDKRDRVWDVRVYEVGSIAAGNSCSIRLNHPLFWLRPSFA